MILFDCSAQVTDRAGLGKAEVNMAGNGYSCSQVLS